MSILAGNDHVPAVGAANSGGVPARPGSPESINDPAESRVRIIVATALIVFGLILLAAKLLHPFDYGDESHGWLLDRLLPRLQSVVGSWSLAMMLSYPIGLLAVFMLERWIPADPTQKVLSTGLLFDVLWLLVRSLIVLTIITVYSRLLYRAYVDHLSFLALPLPGLLPAWLVIVIAVLMGDFTQWLQHWLHHNVKWLWPFHAVHHSQRELNLFSTYRVHAAEYFVRRPIAVLPMLMLGLRAPEITAWLLLVSWHARVQHANIRSNFGPLRYLIVTPQSHRIHHSLRPEHRNQNYGTLLSIWDYLFGTQCRDYEVYPETGIEDESFPLDSAKSVSGIFGTLVRQLVYPFLRVWGLIRGRGTEPGLDKPVES